MVNMRWMKCSRHIKAQTELEILDAYQNTNLQYKLYAAIIHQVKTTLDYSFNVYSSHREASTAAITQRCANAEQSGFSSTTITSARLTSKNAPNTSTMRTCYSMSARATLNVRLSPVFYWHSIGTRPRQIQLIMPMQTPPPPRRTIRIINTRKIPPVWFNNYYYDMNE